MSITKEFVLPLENRPGAFAELAAGLGKEGINIVGFLLEAQGEFGLVRLVTDDAARTGAFLDEGHQRYRVNDAIVVAVPNVAGAVGVLAERLAASGVNIHAAYPSAGPQGGSFVTFVVDDMQSARKILQ